MILTAVVIPAALVLLVGVTFLPSLYNGLVNWDDAKNLLYNPHYRGLGLVQLKWMFTTFHMGVYQPLGWMSFGATYLLWGMKPAGYFLVNVIYHAAATLVFYLVALRLLRVACGEESSGARGWTTAGALAAAAIFAVHPLRVEAVSWATDQPYVLAGLLLLASVAAYLRACRTSKSGWAKPAWLACSVVLFALSLLSKAIGVSLPIVLFVLDVYPLRRLSGGGPRWPAIRRVLIEKVPFVLLAVAAAVVAAYASASYAEGRSALGLADRLAVASHGLAFYVVKTLLPVGLSPFYPYPESLDPLAARFAISAVFVVGVTIALVVARRRWPAGLAAWVCYVAMLVPVLGLVRHASHMTADRYAYLSCLPWAVLVGAGVATMLRSGLGRAVRFSFAAGGVAALLVLGAITWRQQHFWRDSISLWNRVLSVTPPSPVSLTGLGAALAADGRLDDAVERYEAALDLDPDYVDALGDLGTALSQLGRYGEAAEYLEAGLQRRPTDADLHTNLGNALWALQRPESAVAEYRTALEYEPDHVGARYNLALTLSRLGRQDEAVDEYLRLLEREPDHAWARNNLGNIYLSQGHYRKARLQFELAAEAEPDNPTPHINLAMMDVEQRRYPEAVAHFREALARDPDNVLALQKLARLLASCSDRDVRDGEEAVRLAERACAAAGEPRLELLRTLAVAQVEAGRYAEAIQTADQAIALAREAGLDGLAATLGFLRSRCVERLSASPESTQTRPAEE